MVGVGAVGRRRQDLDGGNCFTLCSHDVSTGGSNALSQFRVAGVGREGVVRVLKHHVNHAAEIERVRLLHLLNGLFPELSLAVFDQYASECAPFSVIVTAD